MSRPIRKTPRDRFSGDEADSPVEGGASGAAAFLDGNDQVFIVSWLFPIKKWTQEAMPVMLGELMQYVVAGHLAWVVFPPRKFRIRDTIDLRKPVDTSMM